jgi:hypothetical protein
MAEDSSSGGIGQVLTKAADRLRETTKWLIAAFAAIGGVLIAGSQLSSIGSLAPGDWLRFVIAAAGLLLALAGVAFAIDAAVGVFAAGSVSLGGLATRPPDDGVRQRIDGDRVLLGGRDGLGELVADYEAAVAQRTDAYEAYLADESKLGHAKTTHANAAAVAQTVQDALAVASYEDVVRSFKNARSRLFAGAIVAALGVLAFAAAANPPDDEPEATRPAISTTLNDAGNALSASFDSAGLDPDQGLDVWVTREPGATTLYRGSFGADSSGDVKRTVQLPLDAGQGAQSILLRAWMSGEPIPACLLDGEWDHAGDAACATLTLRTTTSRPLLSATWGDSTLEVKVAAKNVPVDRVAAVRVVAVSVKERRRLYGANLAPALGTIEESIRVPVAARFDSVCVEAKIVPSRATIFAKALATPKRWAACPQKRASDRAWVRLRAPD